MRKNIVLCSDGTGNAAVKNRGTNVFKLFESVDMQTRPGDPSFIPQVAFYDDGVGTETFKPLKLLGGAFGWGLERNVRQLYTELARVFEPGDSIFIFGFSRGAFTVRTLAAIIAQVGIVDRRKAGSDAELERRVKLAFKEHRKCYRRWWSRDEKVDDTSSELFRAEYAVKHDTHAPGGLIPIEFVGVWDTVDAVGFPVDEIAEFWNAFIYPFKAPDTKLSPLVQRACHAIAIDDERYTFHPVLWSEKDEKPGRIEQVWFSGVHSNVGGGYPKQGMSLVALIWMMEQAKQRGLRFLRSVRDLYEDLQNVNDKLYDSRSGIASYYRYKPREIGAMCSRGKVKPKIHLSVVERIALGTEAYSPGNLPRDAEVVSSSQPEIAAKVTEVLRSLASVGPDLLGETDTLIRLRRTFHGIVVAGSLFAVGYVVWYTLQPFAFGDLQSWEGVKTIGGRLGGLLSWSKVAAASGAFARAHLWAVVAVLVALFAGWRIRLKMNAVYSEFWFPLRGALREVILQGGRAQGAAG